MYARSKTEAGFTIVETMIFLAISGLMFVLAVNAMSGKQQQTEFTTSVDTLKSELNQDLSSVADGNYLSLGNYGCSALAPHKVPTFVTPAPSTPDGSCTIIGEVVVFNSTGQKSYDVYPAIGRTYIKGVSPPVIVSNLKLAQPQINGVTKEVVAMPFGLYISTTPSATLNPPPLISGSGLGSFGVFNVTSFDGGAGNEAISSGSSHDEIFGIPSSSLALPGDTQTHIDSTSTGLVNCTVGFGFGSVSDVCADGAHATINDPAGVTFCVDSGVDTESALFTIGGTNSPSTATYQVYDNTDCKD